MTQLNSHEQLHVISILYSSSQQHPSSVPADFLELAFNALCHLHDCGRSDILYLMAKGLGTMRRDESDSLLPAKRMPIGLNEYAANFFTAHSIQQVCLGDKYIRVLCVATCHSFQIKCPSDYRLWLQTMYVLFGSKWAKIFCGPMWSHAPIMQAGAIHLQDQR